MFLSLLNGLSIGERSQFSLGEYFVTMVRVVFLFKVKSLTGNVMVLTFNTVALQLFMTFVCKKESFYNRL